jgi:hypothetical protein
MKTSLYLLASGGIAAVGAWICVLNWISFLRDSTAQESRSIVVFFGAAVFALGLAGLPFVNSFWWGPFVVDIGSIPGLAYVAWSRLTTKR